MIEFIEGNVQNLFVFFFTDDLPTGVGVAVPVSCYHPDTTTQKCV